MDTKIHLRITNHIATTVLLNVFFFFFWGGIFGRVSTIDEREDIRLCLIQDNPYFGIRGLKVDVRKEIHGT